MITVDSTAPLMVSWPRVGTTSSIPSLPLQACVRTARKPAVVWGLVLFVGWKTATKLCNYIVVTPSIITVTCFPPSNWYSYCFNILVSLITKPSKKLPYFKSLNHIAGSANCLIITLSVWFISHHKGYLVACCVMFLLSLTENTKITFWPSLGHSLKKCIRKK